VWIGIVSSKSLGVGWFEAKATTLTCKTILAKGEVADFVKALIRIDGGEK
jgi:hypothetical protein